MGLLASLFGVAERDGEDADAMENRIESLEAAFGSDESFLKAQIEAGRTVPESFDALQAEHVEAITAKDATITDLTAKLAEAEAAGVKATADHAEAVKAAGEKLDASESARERLDADAKNRPPVTADGEAPKTPESEYEANDDLKARFGSFENYSAYKTAVENGQVKGVTSV